MRLVRPNTVRSSKFLQALWKMNVLKEGINFFKIKVRSIGLQLFIRFQSIYWYRNNVGLFPQQKLEKFLNISFFDNFFDLELKPRT